MRHAHTTPGITLLRPLALALLLPIGAALALSATQDSEPSPAFTTPGRVIEMQHHTPVFTEPTFDRVVPDSMLV